MPVYITPELSVFDNAVFQDADNWVFEDGDNVVFGVSGQPPEQIEYLNVGSASINEAYVGADLVYQLDQLQVLTLTSGTDVNLSTWLGTEGADPAKPIIINFASDQVIGGTIDDAPALNLGDLSTYTGGITLNIDGEIQAKAGYDALWAENPIDIINGGTISGEISEGADVSGAPIIIVISSTGKVLAGGGDGGNGGKGGNGDTVGSWSIYRYSDVSPRYQYRLSSSTSSSFWDDGSIGIVGSDTIYRQHSDFMYQRGSNVTGNNYKIRQATYLAGVGGNGGTGGVGAGYLQTRTDGVAGDTGTFRSGNGGIGGNGGDWGVDGSGGAKGGDGLYYSAKSSLNVRAGTDGTSGTLAGNAIVSTATARIYGATSPQALALGL